MLAGALRERLVFKHGHHNSNNHVALPHNSLSTNSMTIFLQKRENSLYLEWLTIFTDEKRGMCLKGMALRSKEGKRCPHLAVKISAKTKSQFNLRNSY